MARKEEPTQGATTGAEGQIEGIAPAPPEAFDVQPPGAEPFAGLPPSEARVGDGSASYADDRLAERMDGRAETLSEEDPGLAPAIRTAPMDAGPPPPNPGDIKEAPELGWGAEPPLAFHAGQAPKDESADRGTWTPPPAEPPARAASLTSVDPAPATPRPAPARRSGFGGLLLGGLLAASLGFGAAWLARERLGPRLPDDLEERLAALEARPQPDAALLEPVSQRLSDLEARLAALEEAEPLAEPIPTADLSSLTDDLEALSARLEAGLSGAEERTAALEERLAAIEARPAQAPVPEAPLGSLARDPGPALAASPANGEAASLEPRVAAAEDEVAAVREALTGLDQRLSELAAQAGQGDATVADLGTRIEALDTALDDLAAQLAEVEARGAAAAEEARAAAAALAESQTRAADAEATAQRAAALARIEAALDAGQPFEEVLADLGPNAPDTLARAAAEGVPSLGALRESFPEAARAALQSARSEGLAADGGGVSGFLWNQLSLRSTAPRAGDDPDAVLSRAEAALAAGRLDEALAEVASLPAPVQSAMAGWIAQAQARAEVQAALAGLRGGEPDPVPAD